MWYFNSLHLHANVLVANRVTRIVGLWMRLIASYTMTLSIWNAVTFKIVFYPIIIVILRASAGQKLGFIMVNQQKCKQLFIRLAFYSGLHNSCRVE